MSERTYGFGRGGRLLVLTIRSLLLVLTIALAIGSALTGTLDATRGLALAAFAALQAFFFYRARDVVHGAVIHPDGAVELTCAFKSARVAPEDSRPWSPSREAATFGWSPARSASTCRREVRRAR